MYNFIVENCFSDHSIFPMLQFFIIIFRYYYDKNIILKTAGKRYVYRFVCDLQGLLGYSPEEIHHMVDLKLEKKEED